MEEQEQINATMVKRAVHLRMLADKFRQRELRDVDTSWFADCVATICVLLSRPQSQHDQTTILTTLAAAMWQAGYEAAPKLEFVLPEGAGG